MNISLNINIFFATLCGFSQHRKVLSIMSRSTLLPHEKYTRARILTGLEAVDLFVNEVFGISVGLGLGKRTFQYTLDHG